MKNPKLRWAYTAGAAVACAGVIVATSLVANAGTRPGALQAGAGAAQSAAPSARPAVPAKPAKPAKPAVPAKSGPLGDVVDTGFGNWVIYAEPVSLAELPKTHFGLVVGLKGKNGTPTKEIVTNETEGSDKAPGFHAVEGTMEIDAGASPTFGYYVGPATKITGKANGKTVTANQAVWSEDASVVFLWFKPGTTVSSLAAYDKTGKKLPTGNSGIAVG